MSEMLKLTKAEYEAKFSGEKENGVVDELFQDCIIGEETLKVECVYVSENDECPYIGYKYTNGEFWIYGARSDQKVSGEDEIKEWLQLT